MKRTKIITGVNEGYLSDRLQISNTETVYTAANNGTTFGELGFDGSGNIVINANDTNYTIGVSSTTTLGDFVQTLRDNDIAASLDATGVFTIDDAEIATTGEFGEVGQALINAFGLSVDIYENTQRTDNLTHTTVITETTIADNDTYIKDLGEGITINESNNKITVVNSDDVTTTITLTDSTKIGDLISDLKGAGLSATINAEGTIEIAGGTITGGILGELGLESQTYEAMVTGNALTETLTVSTPITASTELVGDLGISEGYLKITTPDGGEFYEKIYSGQTISDFISDMSDIGINVELDSANGILTVAGGVFTTLSDGEVESLVSGGDIVEGNAAYIHGSNFINKVYGQDEISLEQTSVASTRAKSVSLTQNVVNTVKASSTTKLSALGLNASGSEEVNANFVVRGNTVTVTMTGDTTVAGLIDILSEEGISASYNAETGKFSLNNASITSEGASSNLDEVLNMSTTVAGKYKTSDSLYHNVTQTVDATGTTTLGTLGFSNALSESERTVTLYNSDGTVAGSMVATESTTVDGLMDFINSSLGITAGIQDGVLTVSNGYIENDALEAALGLTNTNKSSYVLGSVMTYTTTTDITGSSTLGSIFEALGTSSDVSGGYSLSFDGNSIAVNSSTTLNDLVGAIHSNGGRAYIDSTGRLAVEGGALTGSVADALGVITSTKTLSVSATGEDVYAEQVVSADLNTKFSDLGIDSTSLVVNNSQGEAITTLNFNSENSIGDVFTALKLQGIDGTISDGIISLQSLDGKYVTGDLAERFGITSQYTSSCINTNQSSSSGVVSSGTIIANLSTALGDINGITEANQTFEIYDENDACIATISDLTTSSTINDLFDRLKTYGINGTIADGVISLYSSNGNYADGTIMTNLGIGKESGYSTTLTVSNSMTSSENITYIKEIQASLNDKISDFVDIPVNNTISVYSSSGSVVDEIEIDSDTTFSGLFDELAQNGIVGNINNGVISLTPTNGNYISGDIVDSLGISSIAQVTDSTVGSALTGNQMTYTETILATGSTLLSDIAGEATSLIVNGSDGTPTATITGCETIADMLNELGSYGIAGSINNGVISLVSVNGSYITGDIAEALNITTNQNVTNTTHGVTQTGNSINYTVMVSATESTAISDIADLTLTHLEDKQILEIDWVNNAGLSSDLTPTYNGFIANAVSYNDSQIAAMTKVSAVSSFTSGSTYAITTEADLIAFRNLVNSGKTGQGATFVLGADLDLSEINNWEAIGTEAHQFKGKFDGNGHVVSGINIDSNAKYNGLFGYVNSATIKNLGVDGSINATQNCSGGLCGAVNNSTITNCYSEATVNGHGACGGLIGNSSGGTISNCYTTGDVTSDEYGVGGLVGSNSSAISNSYTTGNVKGQSWVGGLVGITYSNVTNCYTTGNVGIYDDSNMGTDVIGQGGDAITIGCEIGGLVGATSSNTVTVKNCYTTGDIENGYNNVGGIVGASRLAGKVYIQNSYATGNINQAEGGVAAGGLGGNVVDISDSYYVGTINGSASVGGLAGIVSGNVSNCYTNGSVICSDALGGGLVGTYSVSSAATSVTNCLSCMTVLGNGASGTLIGGIYSENSSYVSNLSVNGSICATQNIDKIGGYCTAISSTTTFENYNVSNIASGVYSCYTLVSTAQELHDALAAGQSIKLANDIDLDGYNWSQISSWNGIFDGNGYSIKNFTSTTGGLIGTLGADSTVANLNIDYANVTSSGTNAGVIANTCFSADFINTSVTNSSVSAENAGLFIGNGGTNGNTISLDYCYANGTVNASNYAGGFFGSVGANEINISFRNSVSDLKETSSSSNYGVGGLAGSISSASGNSSLTVDNCYISTGDNIQNYGAIAYKNTNFDAENSDINYFATGVNTEWHDFYTPNETIGTSSYSSKVFEKSLEVYDSSNNLLGTIIGCQTIDDLFDELRTYNIIGSIDASGVISLSSLNDNYISGELADVLGISTSSPSSALQLEEEHKLGYSTTFGEVGINSGSVVINGTNGPAATVGVTGTESIAEFFAAMSAYNIAGSIDGNGQLTFNYGGNYYFASDGNTNSIVSALGLSPASMSTIESTTTYSNTTSDTLDVENTRTLNISSTFSNLGLDGGTVLINGTNGICGTINVSGSSTVGDFISALSAYGISGSVSNDGKFNVNYTGTNYLNADSDTIALMNALGVSDENYSTTQTSTTYINGSSDEQSRNIITTMNSSTTFADLGIMSENYVTAVANGTEHIITITSETTIGDMLSTLSGLGISGSVVNGVLSFAGDTSSYIKDMSTNLKNALHMSAGEDESYTTAVASNYINTNSNTLSYANNTLTLTGNTQLSDIAGYSNGNGNLVVHKANGNTETITVNQSSSIDGFFEQISKYGLIGSVNSDGVVSITGIGNVYLESAAGGSNILTALNMGSLQSSTQTITSNRTSDAITYTKTVEATGTTTLENLIDSSGNGITFDGNNVSLILSTTSQGGNVNTTLNFAKTNTIYDVVDRLTSYGINASVDNRGVFNLTSSTATDFDISGTLGNFLMGSYTKSYDTTDTYNVSSALMQRTTLNMDDSTLLSDLGVTEGNFEITQEGIKHTLSISSTDTVGDFRNTLAQYGINSYIDGQGRLTAFGIGESWLDSVSEGSNVVTQFGLNKNKWSLGEITQTSSKQTEEQVSIKAVSMSDKLSDLTDDSGVNLGITSGNIFVYQDGTRNTVSIDANETLSSVATKLSQYGINMGVSDAGVIYFDGNNNSYITNASSNSSNLLTKINADTAWDTRYNSESSSLNYEETVNTPVLNSTKLIDLRDSEGNSLGLTAGKYYVYSNGVRNTETITENTTVNDLLTTLNYYGFTANVSDDGQISVSGLNSSYLASAGNGVGNSNIVDTLFSSGWDFTNIYTSQNLNTEEEQNAAITKNTRLADIGSGNYKAGNIIATKSGVQNTITLTSDETVGSLANKLALYGFESLVNENGQFIIRASGDSSLSAGEVESGYSNILDIMGISAGEWTNTNAYNASLNVITTSTDTVTATRDTALSALGITAGEYNIYNNGVKNTAMISSDETLGSFMDTLESFGIRTSLVNDGVTSVLQILGKGDSRVATSPSVNASNIESLFAHNESTYSYSGLEQTFDTNTTWSNAAENTRISELEEQYGTTFAGTLNVYLNDELSTIEVSSSDTIGELLNKFSSIGMDATILNGKILIQSGFSDLSLTADGSNLFDPVLGLLHYNSDIGLANGARGYSASNAEIEATTTVRENLSVSNYANMDTAFDLLNISSGTLSIYRNGEKAVITIDENETFNTLQDKISLRFTDVKMSFTDDGYLMFKSNIEGNEVAVGSSMDTSNFASITGIQAEGKTAKSARELYRVNNDSVITSEDLFRSGRVTEGTFIIGDAEFNITSSTTINDIVSQINSNGAANATAYWDNIKGTLVLQSKSTGAAYVNIEAGTSNFTDMMGYTSSLLNGDGSIRSYSVDENGRNVADNSKMNVDCQTIGENAEFSINGTKYSSTSNTITSDISRIDGVTIRLKGTSAGENITLTVERDKETVTKAVSDIVNAYNELMTNVDQELAVGGKLHGESTLKMIRNQLRNIMLGSTAGSTVFKNLDAIGIGVAQASVNNISTASTDITSLSFDKEKFLKAYSTDLGALKNLLCGDGSSTGILTKVENFVESTLQGTNGYFTAAENSARKQISALDEKIKKANQNIERYRALLEKKFNTMDQLISQINQQYSSFLTQ